MKLAILVFALSLSAFTATRGAAPDQATSTKLAKPPKPADPAEPAAGWTPLFDGKTLKGWKVTDFAGHGEVTVDPRFGAKNAKPGDPAIILDMGAILTGITWTNEPPKGEFEVTLDTMKIDGSDFFCALTFPAGGGHCSFVMGGWGGSVVGISSIDGMDASENETTKFIGFEKNRWYHVRLRVTKGRIQAWIDKDKVVDVETTDRRIHVRAGEIESNIPFGLAAYQTKAAYRNLRLLEL